MGACPIPALLVPSVLAILMVAGNVVRVLLATVEMASSAKTSMSAKKYLMLASITMENIGARTQILATTACPAHHGSPAHSPSAEASNMPWPTNRCANLETPARMGHMTATRTPSATTWVTTATPCIAVSASPATQAMASSAERTQTWMAGLMKTWCVWPTQPTTAKRYSQLPSWTKEF